MAAGDVKYIGWTTSPQTYEYAARINYVPVYSNEEGDQIIKRVVRSILCHDTVKQSVIQSLKAVTAISAPVVQTDGSLGTESFGGGYRVQSLNDNKSGTGFSLITVVYEKTVSSLLEFNLPTGVTIENSGGRSRILYNSVELANYESGKGETTSGLQIIQGMDPYDALVHLFEGQTARNPEFIPSVPFHVVVDGVLFQSIDIRSQDMENPQFTWLDLYTREKVVYESTKYVQSQALGADFVPKDPPTTIPELTTESPEPFTGLEDAEVDLPPRTTPDDPQKEAEQLKPVLNGDDYQVRPNVTRVTTATVTNTDTGRTYTYPVVELYNEFRVRKKKFMPPVDYGTYSSYINKVYYTQKRLFPEWELNTDTNLLRIHVAGATLLEWDIGGL